MNSRKQRYSVNGDTLKIKTYVFFSNLFLLIKVKHKHMSHECMASRANMRDSEC